MKRAFSIGFVLLAVFAVGCGKKAASSGPVRAEAWLVNYLQDQRIGYSVARVQPLEDGLQFDSYIHVKLSMAGKSQEVQSRSTATTGPDMALRDFKMTFSSQDRSFSASGRVEDGKLIVEQSGGKSRSGTLSGPVFPVAALGRMVARASLKADSVFRVPVFDASVLDVIQAEIHVIGREKLDIGGKEYNAIKYTTQMSKVTMTTWVDEHGLVLQEESPPAMKSVRAEMKDVLAGESSDSKVDILTIFSVPVDTLIPEPAVVRRAKLEISGLEAKEYDFASDNQRVVSESPIVVEVTSPEPPTTAIPLPVKEQAEFLKPTVSVQCDDAGIKTRATQELGKVTDAVEGARKLLSYVFTVMDKEATASFPNAVDVMKTLKGDCNEHSVFYAALARAAGIPTKVVVGLVYLNGAFYYHAWNEVYLGKWVPVDATFGEFPASALHFKAAEGELAKQADVLGLVGRIKIKILEYSN